ncbi:MAG TPA: T9SS type A sorting domain-containing protein, partial [Chitinophagaceae bacterium]|nr:T9SS type A sorting domain-containing protein [Chitinophagaceae bacterium]
VGGQLTTTEKKQPDPGKTFSRMAITSDGAGYAISNDAHHFIEFSTSRQPKITEHGKLVDDPANKNVSIQNSCTSYGGDVVAEDNGKLLLISGRNYVFSIDPATRVATHLALIKGLPPQFTTSAAVVHTDGQLLLSSASGNLGNFLVNPKSWTAVPFTSPGGSFNTSDLANSNVIVTKQKAPIAKREKIRSIINNFSGHLSLYPNPIMSDAGFTIHFNDVKDGAYIVQLIDLGGRPVYSRKINLTQKNTVQNFPVTLTTAKGLYLVRVMDAAKRSVFEHKVMVQ